MPILRGNVSIAGDAAHYMGWALSVASLLLAWGVNMAIYNLTALY